MIVESRIEVVVVALLMASFNSLSQYDRRSTWCRRRWLKVSVLALSLESWSVVVVVALLMASYNSLSQYVRRLTWFRRRWLLPLIIIRRSRQSTPRRTRK